MIEGWFKHERCGGKFKLRHLDPKDPEDNCELECEACNYTSARGSEIMGLCGCNCEDNEGWVIGFLKIYAECGDDKHDKALQYVKDTSQEQLLEFVLHMLNDKDLLEHGSNARWSWITDLGRELLKSYEVYPRVEYDHA